MPHVFRCFFTYSSGLLPKTRGVYGRKSTNLVPEINISWWLKHNEGCMIPWLGPCSCCINELRIGINATPRPHGYLLRIPLSWMMYNKSVNMIGTISHIQIHFLVAISSDMYVYIYIFYIYIYTHIHTYIHIYIYDIMYIYIYTWSDIWSDCGMTSAHSKQWSSVSASSPTRWATWDHLASRLPQAVFFS